MGQGHCQCSIQKQKNVSPKCSLFHSQLLSKFELNQLVSCQQSDEQQFEGRYKKDANSLPGQYIDLLISLSKSKKQYCDIYFPPQNWVINGNNLGRYTWARASTMKSVKNNQNLTKKTKFCLIYAFLKKAYPSFFQSITPVYVSELGFCVCKFYISGVQTEVIVDDYIPQCFYAPEIDSKIHLLQKAFAKVLGSYKYIEKFTVGQIFMQVTGIPYYFAEQSKNDKTVYRDNQKWLIDEKKSFKKFKDALKFDQILYQTQRFANDISVFGYRQHFKLSTISFSAKMQQPHLIKFQIPKKQSISLRISQLSSKFKQQTVSWEYKKLFIQLFKHDGQNNLKPVGVQHRFSNSIYINNIFTDLPAGKYTAFIVTIEQNCKLSLVAYGQSKIKMSEIFSKNVGKNYLNIIAQIQFLLKNHAFKQIGQQVFASINLLGEIICVRFEKNYKNKVLHLANDQLVFGSNNAIEGNSTSIKLDQISDKFIFIMYIQKQNRSKIKWNILQEFFTIS